MFGTLQDRLVKELELAGIADIATANRWIREVYLPQHTARFAKPAALPDKAPKKRASRSNKETEAGHSSRCMRWPRLSEQIFRVDKWSVCQS